MTVEAAAPSMPNGGISRKLNKTFPKVATATKVTKLFCRSKAKIEMPRRADGQKIKTVAINIRKVETLGAYSEPNNKFIIGAAKNSPIIAIGKANFSTKPTYLLRRVFTAAGFVLAKRAISGKMLVASSVGST